MLLLFPSKTVQARKSEMDDELLQVSDMIFPTNFYVLDMKNELSSKGPPLILGKPFLKTIRTKIDVHGGYNIFEAMKHPIENHSIFYLDVIDQLGDDYINLHSGFPYFYDFIDYDCTCNGLNKCLICTKISIIINAGARVVDIAVIATNKLQAGQKERLLQDLKRLEGFCEHFAKHSNLRFLLKKPPTEVALELLRWILYILS
ncbi:hypothetical protein CR513_28327, partial [Mucuna pruriens]